METSVHRVEKVDVKVEKFINSEVGKDFAVVNITTMSRLSLTNSNLVKNKVQLFIDDLEHLNNILEAFVSSNVEVSTTTFDENGVPNTVVEQ